MAQYVFPSQAVALNGTIQTGNDGTPQIAGMGHNTLSNPQSLTIGVKVSAACTATIFISIDGVNWYAANIRNTSTAATITFAGAGAQTLDVSPAPYVQIKFSAAVTASAWIYYF